MISLRILLLLPALCAAFISLSAELDELWIDDPEAASHAAEEEGRILLVFFSGSDWCILCQNLEDGLFADTSVRATLSEHFTPLQLDFPRKKKLSMAIKHERDQWRTHYKVVAYPTILFLDPKTDQVLFRHEYVDLKPAEYVDKVLKPLSNYLQTSLLKKPSPTPEP